MTKDIARRIKPIQSVAPALRTASVNGAAVDLKGFQGAAVVVTVGAVTDGVHTPKLQDAIEDPNSLGNPLASDWADVAASEQEGAFVAAVANSNQWVGYRGVKRFVRAVITTTGGPATGAIVGANVILGSPGHAPTFTT